MPATLEAETVCKRVKSSVRAIEPRAEIILYGSRARGDAEPDSDWDFLVLLEGEVDPIRKTTLWHRLWDLERDLEQVICPLVRSREEWESPLRQAMPLHRNIEREGIVL